MLTAVNSTCGQELSQTTFRAVPAGASDGSASGSRRRRLTAVNVSSRLSRVGLSSVCHWTLRGVGAAGATNRSRGARMHLARRPPAPLGHRPR
jgi:hypothetical protein